MLRKLMQPLVVAGVLCTSGPALAEMSRDETYAFIAKEIAELQDEGRAMAEMSDKSYMQKKAEAILKKARELRDVLRDNPYARVTGFSVGVPFGVSVDFAFTD